MRLRELIKGAFVAMVAVLFITASLPLVPYYARPNETHFSLQWEHSNMIPVVYMPAPGMIISELREGEMGKAVATYWDMAAEIPLFWTKSSPKHSWGIFQCPSKLKHYHIVRVFTLHVNKTRIYSTEEAKRVAHLDFHMLFFFGYGGLPGVTIEGTPPAKSIPSPTIPPGRQYET